MNLLFEVISSVDVSFEKLVRDALVKQIKNVALVIGQSKC